MEAAPLEAELAVMAATACSFNPNGPGLIILANLIYWGKGASSFPSVFRHFASIRSPRGSAAAHARPANQMIRQMKDPPIVAVVGLNYNIVSLVSIKI